MAGAGTFDDDLADTHSAAVAAGLEVVHPATTTACLLDTPDVGSTATRPTWASRVRVLPAVEATAIGVLFHLENTLGLKIDAQVCGQIQ